MSVSDETGAQPQPKDGKLPVPVLVFYGVMILAYLLMITEDIIEVIFYDGHVPPWFP